MYESPTTRRITYSVPAKASGFMGATTMNGLDGNITPVTKNTNRNKDQDSIVDDLTLGYNHRSPIQHHYRSTSERNPTEYAESPSSAMAFRIVSLDGCYEEQVSPLFTDSSSSVASSVKLRSDLPMMPPPILSEADTGRKSPSFEVGRRDKYANKPKTKPITNFYYSEPSATVYRGDSMRKKEEKKKRPHPSGMKQRESNHSRSSFVFDGNLSFGAISPVRHMPAMPPQAHMAYASPTIGSFPGATAMMNCTPPSVASLSITHAASPVLPMIPMLPVLPPPCVFDDGSNEEEHQQRDQPNQKQGRLTPPPTHQEQRRRNRAMPSVQYEKIVFDQLRKGPYLQNQKTW
eukprot:CAMPEP_0201211020 /NCGR_PEP_ID=MMETSP0851-20130426/181459_1 /ASSEMBLY_ACC=CAM_ASM_000631 /TAXON_ID=183588 /ORGANISM="Pseudo-nitzschia fraudulenta, Strain WWA7" /LENGTH=346 /DNA_ID=CAMNT_0047499899 /DNA_START=36 /DNA_END=1076 /DNA_ORIENTATION=+